MAINREEHFIEPFPVRAIDTTGAGDMFAGSLLFGLTHGYSVPDAGRLACFLASRVVAQLGPRLPGSVRQIAGVEQVLHG